MQNLSEHIAEHLGDILVSREVRLNELILTVRKDAIVRALAFLRDDSTVIAKCWWTFVGWIIQAEKSGLRLSIIF